jgi:hypothetical protein
MVDQASGGCDDSIGEEKGIIYEKYRKLYYEEA